MPEYVAQSHVAIGDLATASAWNTNVDNHAAFWGIGATGKVPYFETATKMAGVVPGGLSFLYHTGSAIAALLANSAYYFPRVNAAGTALEMTRGFTLSVAYLTADIAGTGWVSLLISPRIGSVSMAARRTSVRFPWAASLVRPTIPTGT